MLLHLWFVFFQFFFVFNGRIVCVLKTYFSIPVGQNYAELTKKRTLSDCVFGDFAHWEKNGRD